MSAEPHTLGSFVPLVVSVCPFLSYSRQWLEKWSGDMPHKLLQEWYHLAANFFCSSFFGLRIGQIQRYCGSISSSQRACKIRLVSRKSWICYSFARPQYLLLFRINLCFLTPWHINDVWKTVLGLHYIFFPC